MKSTVFTLVLLTMSSAAWAASNDDSQQQKVEEYRYSTHLDVARVISMSNDSYCGIGQREMTYEDSSGVTRTLRYPAFGNACIDEN